MAPGYGISSIGSYANDPYFMYALNSYNPNFMGIQQASSQTAVQPSANAVSTTPSVDTSNIAVDPSFKGSPKDSDDGISTGKLIAGGLMIAGGALACIKAYKKGDGTGLKKMLNGFKQYSQKFLGSSAKEAAEKASNKADDAANKISNIIKNGGTNLKDCTIKNGADDIVFKNGEISKITQKTETKVKNITNVSLPSGINASSKDVHLDHIERTISHKGKDYKVIMDKNGSITEAFRGKNKIDVDSVEGLADAAQTYTKELKGIKLTLPDKNNVPTDYTRAYNISVRNGEVVDATYMVGRETKHLTSEQCKQLQEAIPDEIAKFGRAKNGYGLTPQECIYEYTGANRRYLFNGNTRKVTDAYDIQKADLVSPKKVDAYLEKHNLQNIKTDDKLPENLNVSSATYESSKGIYTIKDGKIVSIKLKEGCHITPKKGKKSYIFRAGETITPKDNRIDIWQGGMNINQKDYQAVLELLK